MGGVAVVVAAALVWYLPGLRHHGGPSALRPSAAAPQDGLAAAPDPLPTRPALMTGQPLPSAADVRLLLGGQQPAPAWLMVPSGRTEPISGLPERARSYQVLPTGGGWTAQPFPPGNASCGSCAPPPAPVYYIADGARAASRIGTAAVTAPAAPPGAVWLVSYRAGADMSTAAGSAQEVSVGGAALGPRLLLPPGYAISQGTRAGLLLVQEQAPASHFRYELWDPATRQVTRSFVNVIAASPTQIAWAPVCAGRCLVHVLDLVTGQAREIPLPGLATAGNGAFSPDGQMLALQLMAGSTATDQPATNQLIVARLATGQLTAVPGTTVGSGIGLAFGWQPASRQLIAAVTVTTQGQPEWQIGKWQPGDARLSSALVRTPDQSWPVIDQGPY
ncbi:MAG TPA: hypothetical protein VMU95_34625 [Trebonia sp.]|nr:hypothetical protein [Trebonia sp.]